MELLNKSVAVVGMAKSGLAAVNLLVAQGARVRAIDEKPSEALREPLSALGVALYPQTAEAFAGVELIVISPGVPADLPLLEEERKKGVAILGELELASYYLKGRVIGITGSNGKTTTTALTGHILRESGIDSQVGGNIGTPPAAMIAGSRADRWNVLELSSFQLETIRNFRADIAIALNVTDNHLDRHHTFENYAAAKARLFETQDRDGFAILNADNEVCVSFAKKTRGSVKWFSRRKVVFHGASLRDGVVWLEDVPLLRASEIPLRGAHNIENVMAASLAAQIAGASPAAIASAVRGFPGVEHRIEFVRTLRGVEYFNDSKATSVDAAMKAIDAFDAGLWIILGGKDKNSDYTVMREALGRKARMALLIGAAAQKIESQLRGAVPILMCGTLDAAVSEAAREAKTGETVLLSPACSSFDQFQSYEHRGRLFKELVNALTEGNG